MEAESPQSAVEKLTKAVLKVGIDISPLQDALSVRNQSWQAATDHARATLWLTDTRSHLPRDTC